MTKTDKGATNAWDRYEPSAEAPWDLRRVVHLHRRAGFAASWGEIQRDLDEGPEASVDRLLEGKCPPVGAPEPDEFERTAAVLGEAATASSDSGRLKAWWFYRLLFTPDPLGERLTLMWHNHFATSIQKVGDLGHAPAERDLPPPGRKPFGELLAAMVRDPALLIWLDAPANRKGHPNENLARELMELFTLGIGHYSESDVKETARALTGWTVDDGEFREAPRGTTTATRPSWASGALERRGRGPDPPGAAATADRLAWRLCELFMGEGAVEQGRSDALADGLRSHHLDIGWAVETILRSRAFFAESNIRTRVLGPVEYIVGAVRAPGTARAAAQHARRWPTGRRGWDRTSSTRPTSAAGRAAGAGYRRDR